MVAACVVGALGASAVATPLAAQQRQPLPPSAAQAAERIRREQLELERLRQERATLEARMRQYQSSARNLTQERQNLDRQAEATARMVRSLDDQLGTLYEEVNTVNASVVRTQDELAIKQATLTRRVQDIYKRGPLFALEAMLSAESFGSLVARYKYLHLAAKRDRALVQRVQTLSEQVTAQRFLLVRLQNDVEANRREKAEEEARLRRLEIQRGRSLAQVEAQARQASQRLQQIARDEARLTSVIAALEESRRRAEAAAARSGGAAPAARGLSTADLGRLDWPVDGTVVYRFGRVVSPNPNRTDITWNGMGIGAPIGTAVKVIADGEVVFAEPAGTYGRMLIVQHGGGAYSIYASLAEFRVQKGAQVKKGDVIGTVGQADPDPASRRPSRCSRGRGTSRRRPCR
jgi:murein hydrolase activator